MANMFDYLTWRGDLSLSQSPFQDVDSLILNTAGCLAGYGILCLVRFLKKVCFIHSQQKQ